MNILIVENEESTLNHLYHPLKEEGYVVSNVSNCLETLKSVHNGNIDLIFIYLSLQQKDRFSLVQELIVHYPDIDILLSVQPNTIKSIVERVNHKKIDYISMPFTPADLIFKINETKEKQQIKKKNLALKLYFYRQKAMNLAQLNILQSSSMKTIIDSIKKMNYSNSNVLITGEEGTDKNLISQFIHHTSIRQEKPFIEINCADYATDLLASELFGYDKAAFSNAHNSKPGLFEIADTGTLFLDQISAIPLNLQFKLLELVEKGELSRIGAAEKKNLNLRFIVSDNPDLSQPISNGLFSEDLYYLFRIIELDIPPLRERQEDILPLSQFFLKKYLKKYNKNINDISTEALTILLNYHYPGNIRELENIIEQAVILENSCLLDKHSLPVDLIDSRRNRQHYNVKTIDEVNKEYVQQILNKVDGNKTRAAKLLGISRTSLRRILGGKTIR